MCLTEGTKFEKLGNHYTSTTPNHPSIQSPSYPSTTTPCHPCTRSIKRINHLYKHWWAEQYTRYGLTSYSYELHTNRNKHKTRQCWMVPQPGEGISASGDRIGRQSLTDCTGEGVDRSVWTVKLGRPYICPQQAEAIEAWLGVSPMWWLDV